MISVSEYFVYVEFEYPFGNYSHLFTQLLIINSEVTSVLLIKISLGSYKTMKIIRQINAF